MYFLVADFQHQVLMKLNEVIENQEHHRLLLQKLVLDVGATDEVEDVVDNPLNTLQELETQAEQLKANLNYRKSLVRNIIQYTCNHCTSCRKLVYACSNQI